jgi:hypothetical protein
MRMDTLGRVLLVIGAVAATVLLLPLLLFGGLGLLLASAGELDYGVACRDRSCVDEAWGLFAASSVMVVGTVATIALIVRNSRSSLRAASVVAAGYGLVGLLHGIGADSLLWLPAVTAGLLALGSAFRFQARSNTATRGPVPSGP